MGCCFSKKTNTTALTPAPQISDLKSADPPPHTTTNDHHVFKKEIFVIKHRLSHEIDRHSDQESHKNPSSTATGAGARLRTPSCSKEELDTLLIQCHRLSRTNSSGTQNPNCRRTRSRSENSFDLGSNVDANTNNDPEDDVDDALDHRRHRHRRTEFRVSSSRRSSSKERRISISPSRRSSSKERRISISPSRRSESPFSNKNPNPAAAGSSNQPVKMVSVPATDKTNNAGVQQPVAVGPVKRIHVKRNVSPARIRVFTDDNSQVHESSSSIQEVDHRWKSLAVIDNNAGRCAQLRDNKRTRRLSRDLDMNQEPVFEPSLSLSPSPPSYASLLLEDIQNFHKKNTATTPPSFALPECVSKACLIMEAVADMNSNTSSLCSDDRWRNTTMKKESSGMT